MDQGQSDRRGRSLSRLLVRAEDSLDTGGLKAVAFSSGGQRDQHRCCGPIPHSGAAQGPAGGCPFVRAVSSGEHHHPLEDLLPWTPEPVRVPGKQACGPSSSPR